MSWQTVALVLGIIWAFAFVIVGSAMASSMRPRRNSHGPSGGP